MLFFKNILSRFAGVFVILLVGCADLMKKEIDVNVADYPPYLAVTAILDSDGGCFSLTMSEGRSNARYKNWKPVSETISCNGIVRLYMDDDPAPVASIDGRFDLLAKSGSVYDTIIAGIPAKVGSTYRLEASLDGYPVITSTAVMPSAPVYTAVIDTSVKVRKENVFDLHPFGNYSGYSRYFYPIDFSLDDHPETSDYYAIHISESLKSTTGTNENTQVYDPRVGTNNIPLLQDNPDIEAKGIFSSMDGESHDLYLFGLMLISDISFTSSPARLQIYTSVREDYGEMTDRVPDDDLQKYGPEEIRDYRIEMVVKHITSESFQHYRSMALQNEGNGIFTEPVSIKSNIENGAGCFSLCNTSRVKLLDYVRYYYSGTYY